MEEKLTSSSEAVGVSPFGPRDPIRINIYNFGHQTRYLKRGGSFDALLQKVDEAYSILERATKTVSLRPKIDLLTLLSELDMDDIRHIDYIDLVPDNFIVCFYFRTGDYEFKIQSIEPISFRVFGTPLTIATDYETHIIDNFDQAEYSITQIRDGKGYQADDIHTLINLTKYKIQEFSNVMRHATYYRVYVNAV